MAGQVLLQVILNSREPIAATLSVGVIKTNLYASLSMASGYFAFNSCSNCSSCRERGERIAHYMKSDEEYGVLCCEGV
jgi:hypothetical protein